MPIGSAFHERTLQLCESLNYRDWAGYYAVSAYETHHEHEYNAIRNACALIDVSPLYKYRVSGRDAGRLVDRVITRDASKLGVGQVYYTPWCDEEGKVIDDGTVTRVSDQVYRWTAADPNLRWITRERGRSGRQGRRYFRAGRSARVARTYVGTAAQNREYGADRDPEILPGDRWLDRGRVRWIFLAPATLAISATRSGCRGTPR